MGVPGLFRQYKPKGFNMIPRYYDPEKERREERVKRIKMELGIRDDEQGKDFVPSIQRGSMSNYFRQKTRKVQKYTLIRTVVIIMLLGLIAYFIVYV
jgi:hypothetical protein